MIDFDTYIIGILIAIFILKIAYIAVVVGQFLRTGIADRTSRLSSLLSGDTRRKYFAIFHADTTAPDLTAICRGYVSRPRYLSGLVILLFTVTLFLLLPLLFALEWVEKQTTDGLAIPFPPVLAILGTYAFVALRLTIRSLNGALVPRDMYMAALKFLLSLLMTWGLSFVVQPAHVVFVAIAVPAIPFDGVYAFALRKVARQTDLAHADDRKRLSSLPCMSSDTIERIMSEDITTLHQLTYTDPVVVTMRTGLDFTYVTCCANEAMLDLYFGDHSAVLRTKGILGACECRWLWSQYNTGSSTERKEAEILIAEIADETKLSVSAVRNIVMQIASDPFTIFYEVWWGDVKQRIVPRRRSVSLSASSRAGKPWFRLRR